MLLFFATFGSFSKAFDNLSNNPIAGVQRRGGTPADIGTGCCGTSKAMTIAVTRSISNERGDRSRWVWRTIFFTRLLISRVML
jgi:hypothetical protein